MSHEFVWFSFQGTFGREPQARPDDDRYLRAAIQEYDNIAKLGQIMREGPIKVRNAARLLNVLLIKLIHLNPNQQVLRETVATTSFKVHTKDEFRSWSEGFPCYPEVEGRSGAKQSREKLSQTTVVNLVRRMEQF